MIFIVQVLKKKNIYKHKIHLPIVFCFVFYFLKGKKAFLYRFVGSDSHLFFFCCSFQCDGRIIGEYISFYFDADWTIRRMTYITSGSSRGHQSTQQSNHARFYIVVKSFFFYKSGSSDRPDPPFFFLNTNINRLLEILILIKTLTRDWNY